MSVSVSVCVCVCVCVRLCVCLCVYVVGKFLQHWSQGFSNFNLMTNLLEGLLKMQIPKLHLTASDQDQEPDF